MLTSVVLFSTMDSAVKWYGATYPTQQIMFFRCVVAIFPVSIFLLNAGGFRLLKTSRPVLHLLRSMIGLVAMGCAFYGFTLIPLAEASAVFYTAPLLAVLISIPVLGEQVGLRRWTAVVLGLAGALIVIRPGFGLFGIGAAFMFAAALAVAITTNIIRLLGQTDDPACIAFYFTLSGSVVSTLLCLWFGWVTPSLNDLVGLIGIGVLGGCAQYTMTLAYRLSQIGMVAPLKYLSIVAGSVLGYLIWSELPDPISLSGMTIIIATGIYTIRREVKLAKPDIPAPQD